MASNPYKAGDQVEVRISVTWRNGSRSVYWMSGQVIRSVEWEILGRRIPVVEVKLPGWDRYQVAGGAIHQHEQQYHDRQV